MSNAFYANLRKRESVSRLDSSGQIADSLEVRGKLIEQMQRGEKTLEQIQAELALIKRDAKRSGKLTRARAWRES